jgi:hypothetical protein
MPTLPFDSPLLAFGAPGLVGGLLLLTDATVA